ncbi:MAG: FAD-binding oxidoreductase [Acidimicrobiia bacterium]
MVDQIGDRRLIDALSRLVGAANVVTDRSVTESYTTDWTGRFVGSTPCVVRPGSVDEVAAVLAWCNANGVAVVPQGGNTGLVGGSVPLQGEIVVSLRRLDAVSPVDAAAAQLTVGAGATLASVHRAAASAGSAFAVDLHARDTATIGGMVATNAGGLRVVRYGPMRAQVAGLEAVKADGTVLSHLSGLLKDNTGYDWPGLVVGSEGTLAVVTAARLRLVPEFGERVTALVAVPSMSDAVGLAVQARAELADLDAIEFVDAACVELVRSCFATPLPVGSSGMLMLIECAGVVDPTAALADVVGDRPAAVASESVGRARLWQFRDLTAQAIARSGVPHKLDVTLPLGRLAEFVDAVPSVVAPPARAFQFGHVADGNVHVNVLGLDPHDESVDDAVLQLCASMGGSISAEHGIGVAKKRWLSLCRTPAEIETFRAIKNAWDPNAILNPQAMLPG